MSQQRAAQLLRQAAEALLEDQSTPRQQTSGLSQAAEEHSQQQSPPMPNSAHTNNRSLSHSSALSAATRALFAPYRFPNTNNSRRRVVTGSSTAPCPSYWTHRFCVLASSMQDVAPSREEKHALHKVGLGEKKITFLKNSDPAEFQSKLEEHYPKLKNCGGYELLRSAARSRLNLEVMKMPAGGYNTNFLSDSSNLYQAMCYVRPIQKDLDVHIDTSEDVLDDGLHEACINCGQNFPIRQLREHVQMCNGDIPDDYPPPKKAKRDLRQTPVCQYACDNGVKDVTIAEDQQCPVCLETFPGDMLAVHASSCGETADVTLHVDEDRYSKTPDEALVQVFDTLSGRWEVAVIRRHFLKTAMEQLDDGSEEDWGKKLKVRFIGEEGVDEGGLSREFFTLLFLESPVFEDNLLSADADLLSKRYYNLMGKVTAMALLSGHPGPRCLEQHLVDFIILGKSPDMPSLCTDVIKRQDVMHAIDQIQKVSDQNEGNVNVEHGDLLDQVNFRRRVTKSNKEEAVEAVKAHFLMYRCLPGLLQYMEGLKVNGVLDILKKYPESKKYFIKPSGSISASEVMDMYSPSFSKNDDEKSDEEMVIYNMHQFLKNVERGRVTTVHIDIYAEDTEEDTQEVAVKMEHVLQSLTGCAHAPSNLAGIIYFDHLSTALSSVNTCVPSINFSSIKELGTYKTMEAHMLHIIFGTLGFGIV